MRILITCLLLATTLFAGAQRACHSVEYARARAAADPAAAQGALQANNFLSRHAATARFSGAGVVRIPVVVHVLYNTASQNLTDDQVHSQIDALNRDFRRLNADTSYTPERFRSVAADAGVEFVLATATPEGYPTTGIVRKNAGVAQWGQDDAMKFSSSRGDNAWDSRYYLNIWVCPMGRVLGYATAPGSAADRDGVVINTTAFGTIGAAAPYNGGRTAVHEVGHWLGLKHIWGDTYCGDDGIADTPQQSIYSSGCPSGVRVTCGNAPTGDMYMNYMDYTNDACLNLFTNGQVSRMRACFTGGGPRSAILSSRGSDKPWSTPPPAVTVATPASTPVFADLTIYPNPAASVLNIQLGSMAEALSGREILLYNTQGALVQRVRITGRLQQLPTASLSAGVYWLVIPGTDGVLRRSFVKQ